MTLLNAHFQQFQHRRVHLRARHIYPTRELLAALVDGASPRLT